MAIDTPTPAQQHIEVLRELRTESVLCDIDPVVTDALDYAIACIESQQEELNDNDDI